MTDKKYYTPTIEEFHVGFEFETKYILFSRNGEWMKCIFSVNELWFWDEYEHDAYKTEFRVKYLDREDIESLGLKFIGCELEEDRRTCKFPIIYEVRKRDTDNIFDLGKAEITLVNISENIYNLTNYKLNPARKISGAFIKNKSELKRLMKQLGI